MEIYLIRHTTPDIAKEICYGQSDIRLAETFPEESGSVLNQLPFKVDRVYTSPLTRCLQLAKLIPSQEITVVPELMEMNFGDWELKPWSEIPQTELDPWMADFVNHQVPGGESMNMLADRVLTWYRSIPTLQLDSLAIVTHAGPIRILQSEVNQTPLGEAFQRYSVNYGEVIRLDKS